MDWADFNRSLTWLWLPVPKAWGTLADCQSSPRHRSGTGHRGPTICHQRPCTSPCNPKAAQWGQGGWAASCHAWGGHKSWRPLSPSRQHCWQFCHDAKHQSMCPATVLFAWPCNRVPHQLVALPQKTMICWSLSWGCPP